MRRARASTLLALTACGAGLAYSAGGATAGDANKQANARVIRVADDSFSPGSTSVVPNRVVKWVWAAGNRNTHNVRLRRAPAGVDKGRFSSPSGRTDLRFSRRLRKPGEYRFVCAFHGPQMRHTVTVRR